MYNAGFPRIRLLIPALLLVLFSITSSAAQASGSRDILWDIVSTCLDASVADYCADCSWPRSDSSCASGRECRQTTEVWGESDAYVAIRDTKMCGCPDGFVHGLALPRSMVLGVEDPERPDGIWKFAWDVAVGRVSDRSSLALVANPANNRGQDQLHVHLVRLNRDALKRIADIPTVTVHDLDQVWKAAARSAASQGLDDYGVLVFPHPDGGFTVLVDRENPEKKYTRYRCR